MKRRYYQGRESPLVSLANEYLIPIRKAYGMYSQINTQVESISREVITCSINIGKPFNRTKEFSTQGERQELVTKVVNAFRSRLNGLVPCPRYEVIYYDFRHGISEKEFNGEFYKGESRMTPPGEIIKINQSPIVAVVPYLNLQSIDYPTLFKEEWNKLE